ncbi:MULTISPECIES: hypothetical protein [Methanobacterium]|jgi:hypothetical protein|uniref:Uncharacterized protein n=1 Tax=Methanobacterium veterum TaxID=408577 RepID=A0A9E4ZTS8_9EURY|nr:MULTISPECIES: hypothetical protein [Methanobacterium]MCZ3365044.1 hypothetical protein [Methanobacterium veterum]MCZ3372799.1 hypothetical protein [Methanobacterium veterum]
MLEYVNHTIEQNIASKDIKIKYKDTKLTKEQYNYLKNSLNLYMFTTNYEKYPMIPLSKYNEYYESLTINLIISTPSRSSFNDSDELNRILETHITGFQEFYEKQKEEFNLINSKKDR